VFRRIYAYASEQQDSFAIVSTIKLKQADPTRKATTEYIQPEKVNMNDRPNNDLLLQDLVNRVEALERGAPKNQLTLGIVSRDLEHTMAAFMVALGATTFDMEVEMFFMFWGIAALRDPKKKLKNDLLDSTSDTEATNAKYDLKKHGAMSLEELIEMAGESGVRITVCNLSMDLMGIKREELFDYPNLSFAGVAAFVDMCTQSKQCWFM
jgi:peroxiredoxin family protein